MADSRDTAPFRFWLGLIRLIGVIVPRRLRADWRQEWEAELRHRELLLAEWDRLNWRTRLSLLCRSLGAFWDALWLQQLRWEDEMFQDLRYGVRMLLKSKGFTTVAGLSLALGIGVNTAVFSLIDTLFLRELNVADPGSLVSVHTPLSGGGLESWFPRPVFEQLRDHNQSFSAVLGWVGSNLTVSANGEPAEIARVGFLGGDYYSVLGVGARLGRAFTSEDDRPDQAAVAVISYRYWQNRFSGRESVLDQTIEINGIAFRIIGVTPPEFSGLILPALNPGNLAIRDNSQDIGLPMACYSYLNRNSAPPYINITARLKPSATMEQARAEVNVIYTGAMSEALDPGMPEEERRQLLSLPILLRHAAQGDPFRQESYKLRVGILMGVVGIVLLSTCANIANLLLARSRARRKEIAIRIAIGAGRVRLVRQLLMESLLLAISGGVLGLWFAILAQQALGRLLQLGGDPSLDWRVLGFAAGVSVAAAALFGLAPALRATSVDLNEGLKARAGGANGANRHRQFGFGKALVVFQVALSLVLMTGAGLLVRSLQNLNQVEIGFDPQNVLLFWIYPGTRSNSAVDAARLYEDFLQRFNNIPGVLQASMSRHSLMQGAENFMRVSATGNSDAQDLQTEAAVNTVAPGFFATMRIPLLAGRDFSLNDREGAPKVAIINQRFAGIHFGSASPLGKRILLDHENQSGNEELEIVGVVNDTRYYSLRQDGRAPIKEVFVPFTQASADRLGQMCFALRTVAPPMSVLGEVRREAKVVEKRLPVAFPTTQADVIRDSVREERSLAVLTSFFGALALLLSCIGLYGVMSYSVTRRTHEIGIRLALGAQVGVVLRLVIGQGMKLVLLGVASGLVAAFALTRVLAHLLFGVSAVDPVTLLAVALLLVGMGLSACYFPARRAAKVDPMTALRSE